MGRPSFKDRLVASGMRTVHEGGFAATGLRTITAAAGVAQGSFTNHFASKDEFGVAVLEHYFGEIKKIIAATLDDPALRPTEQLAAYFEAITALLRETGWRYGCLAGNMALESAELSDLIRTKLSAIFAAWTPPFAEAIRRGQAAGEIRASLDPEAAGAALLEAWHGAMLRMKVERSPEALDRFKHLIMPALLGTRPPRVRGTASASGSSSKAPRRNRT